MSTCIVSFSSRADGNCSQIGKLLCSLIQDAVLFDFSEFEVHPCGKCDYDCFTSRDKCPYIGDMEYHLLDAVTNSERTYFILPNYCDIHAQTILSSTRGASAIFKADRNCWNPMKTFRKGLLSSAIQTRITLNRCWRIILKMNHKSFIYRLRDMEKPVSKAIC